MFMYEKCKEISINCETNYSGNALKILFIINAFLIY